MHKNASGFQVHAQGVPVTSGTRSTMLHIKLEKFRILIFQQEPLLKAIGEMHCGMMLFNGRPGLVGNMIHVCA